MDRVQWSFSGLKDFVNCPRKYNEVKVRRNFAQKTTEQMLYGTEVHKALEDYTRDGTPLPKNYERFKPVMDSLLEAPGTRYPEQKLALNRDRQPCAFDAPDYWVRGIVDLLIIDGDTAIIIDYKTGSAKYPDPKQLKLMALMTFAHHPMVNKIRAGLLFVVHEVFIPEEYDRGTSDQLWDCFTPDLIRMQAAYDDDIWHPNPSPLCGWCPVESCEYHKPRRRF